MSVSPQKALKPLDVVRAEFNSPMVQEQLIHALPKHIDKGRFTRVAMTTIAQNPKLLECNRASLFRSVMTCAQLGLLPDAVLGEAYMVPYKNDVTLQIGYKGLLKLARQSGQISTVETGVIHSNDTFEWEQGITSKFRIVPRLGERGDPIAVFAVIRYRDGGYETEVMTVEEVEAIRKRAPSANSPAWKESWGEMARKTVLRRILKKAPLSTEAAMAVAASEAAEERGEQLAITDGGLQRLDAPAPPKMTLTKRGRQKLEELAAQAEEIVMETPADQQDEDGDSVE